jgi:hypothetical protein|tara:strand:- start:843 stop:1067 length:225 start_codon:yes stop_codon:yes gene_type:complete
MAESVAVWCGYVEGDVCRAAVLNNPLSVALILLIIALGVPPLSRAECQTNQTVSGQEVCEEDDDSNGAYNLMER